MMILVVKHPEVLMYLSAFFVVQQFLKRQYRYCRLFVTGNDRSTGLIPDASQLFNSAFLFN
jgi:hypothetical protein